MTLNLFDDTVQIPLPTPRVSEDYWRTVCEDWDPLIPTEVFATYWRFAAARQETFFRRVALDPPPWTDDPILRDYKFTNTYRASDRVSQYLIRNVIYPAQPVMEFTDEDIVFRILLFKILNRVSAWQLLENRFGNVTWRSYRFDEYDQVLSDAMSRGEKIFSAAYIMPSGQSTFGEQRKHRNYLRLLERIMHNNLPQKLARCKSLEEIYCIFLEQPLMGPFLAFQYTIDLNYSDRYAFDESDFVVAGPGARDGIAKCFENSGIRTPEKIISLMAEFQDREFERLGIEFRSLWGRKLQLIDCQNLFCEVGKYARIAHPSILGISGRSRIKQNFKPSYEPFLAPFYPPHWKLGPNIRLLSVSADHATE